VVTKLGDRSRESPTIVRHHSRESPTKLGDRFRDPPTKVSDLPTKLRHHSRESPTKLSDHFRESPTLVRHQFRESPAKVSGSPLNLGTTLGTYRALYPTLAADWLKVLKVLKVHPLSRSRLASDRAKRERIRTR